MGSTEIEWASKVWNFTRGCRRVSAGCGGAAGEGGCYAERQAYRFSGPGQPYEGLVRLGKHGPQWTGRGRFVAEKLAEPLRWRKPKDGGQLRIFVNSMSDLFFEEFNNEEIAAAFGVMAACPQHDFLILTKRPARMRDWFAWLERTSRTENAGRGMSEAAFCLAHAQRMTDARELRTGEMIFGVINLSWPVSNVWLGVSAEDQATADERIPLLLETPAAVRWVSAEPLLGSIDFFAFLKTPLRDEGLAALRSPEMPGLDWVVVGSESGPGARPMDLPWAVQIAEDCQEAGVPIFTKQIATPDGRAHGDPRGGDPGWWPVYMPREFPR